MLVFTEISATLSPELASLLQGDTPAAKKHSFSSLMRTLDGDLQSVHLKYQKKNLQVVADWDTIYKIHQSLQSWMVAHAKVKLVFNNSNGRTETQPEISSFDINHADTESPSSLEKEQLGECDIVTVKTEVNAEPVKNTAGVSHTERDLTESDLSGQENTPSQSDEQKTREGTIENNKLGSLEQDNYSLAVSHRENGNDGKLMQSENERDCDRREDFVQEPADFHPGDKEKEEEPTESDRNPMERETEEPADSDIDAEDEEAEDPADSDFNHENEEMAEATDSDFNPEDEEMTEPADSDFNPEVAENNTDTESDENTESSSSDTLSEPGDKSVPSKASLSGKKCEFCQDTFSSFAECRNHKREEHLSQYLVQLQEKMKTRPPSNKQCCPECYMQVDNLEFLEEHFKKLHCGKGASTDMQGTKAFVCSSCDHSFKSRIRLREHCQNVHWTKQFECAQCGKLFGTKRYLNLHLRMTHVQKTFTCNICGVRRKNKYSLRQHIRNMHEGKKKDLDEEQELSNYIIRLQQRIPDKIPSNKQCCPKCYILVDNFEILKQHFKNIHWKMEPHVDKAGKKSYPCSTCYYVCHKRIRLKEHCERKHWSKQVECVHCGKSFGTQRILKVHIKGSHGDHKWTCSTCGVVLKNRSSLNYHIKTVHGGKPKENKVAKHLCVICGKLLWSRRDLQEHVNKHNGVKDLKCDTCGRDFFSQSTLRSHIKSTHTETKEQFACEICGKLYKSAHVVRIHAQVVHSAKAHKCQECGKSFVTKTTLERHSRIHSGVKPYPCHMCDKAFNDSSILRRHLMGVHKTNYRNSGKKSDSAGKC